MDPEKIKSEFFCNENKKTKVLFNQNILVSQIYVFWPITVRIFFSELDHIDKEPKVFSTHQNT